MFSKTALLASATLAASATANTGYVTVFLASTENAGTSAACTDNGAPVFNVDLTVGGCSAVETASGTVVYAKLGDCSAANGAWDVEIHGESTCSGTALVTTSGSDACDCGTGTLGAIPVGIRASCGAPQNNCYWYQQYDSSVCNDATDASADTEGYYISGETCLETNTQAMTISCTSGTYDSAWTAAVNQVALSKATESVSACSGSATSTVGGSTCDACISAYGDDFYAETSQTFKVNCGGFNPTPSYMCGTADAPTAAPSASPDTDDSYGDDDDSYAVDDDDAASSIASGAVFLAGSLAAISAVYLM